MNQWRRVTPNDRNVFSESRLRKWVKVQEAAIEQARIVASKALAAGNLSQCLLALQLATRTQGELIALVAPKKTARRSKSAAETEPTGSEAEEDAVPTSTLPDFSQMSDEEVARLAKAEVTPAPVVVQRKPSSRPRGRAKGCEASGVAKEAKERAQERRGREQREREASEHPAREHDAVIASPVPIPPGWEE
jgi:hypothetical protein